MKNIDSMQTISILGCGKLGFPITFDLLNERCYIKGSTTSVSKWGYLLD
ncbi:uncharacterized protein METZ01_LOCUS261955 [marine metagenome]|uniref:6-phosphogluconate dehydrogenase NADP-binding domain-containing protein n=1 Tax=marine metagenome TaxID=408172 RepID=A0A382JEF9_9ZZZZ